MRSTAEITAADSHGDKVLLLEDGTYLKLFRIKRLITSARLFPYWRRFVNNAEGLRQLAVPTLEVIDILKVPHLDRTGVHYRPLAGQTLREVIELDEDIVRRLAAFMQQLHDQGVYLRSLHLGNVVQTPEGKLGLIDVADMKIHRSPLSLNKRKRNFMHLARYEEDRLRIAKHLDAFAEGFEVRLQGIAKELFSRPVG